MREILSPTKERDKNAEYHEHLGSLLKNIAQEMNCEFEFKLLNEDCSIKMRAFQKRESGPYDKEEIKNDEKIVKNKEIVYSEAVDENVRQYYKDTYGVWNGNDTEQQQIEKTVQKWKKIEEKRIGNLLEMAIVGIFYKILKNSDLSIMRSAKYDDYEHGADTVIVDKETGKVICALDEVSDEEGKDERREEKLKRIRNNAKKHGGELKYGITFEKTTNGKNRVLVKKNIKDIPMFCLNLSKDELKKVLDEMEFDINKDPRGIELAVFKKMVALMEEQTKILLNDQIINENVKDNLQAIPEALQKMKKAGAKYQI